MRTHQLIALLCFYIIGLTGCSKIVNRTYIVDGKASNGMSDQGQTDEDSDDTIANLEKIDEIVEKLEKEIIEEKNNNDIIKELKKLNNITANLGNEEVIDETLPNPKADHLAQLEETPENLTSKKNTDEICNNIITHLDQVIEMVDNEGNQQMIYETDIIPIAHDENSNPGNSVNQSIEIESKIRNKITPKEKLSILEIVKKNPQAGPNGIANILSHQNRYISSNRIYYWLSQYGLTHKDQRIEAKKNGRLEKLIKELKKTKG